MSSTIFFPTKDDLVDAYFDFKFMSYRADHPDLSRTGYAFMIVDVFEGAEDDLKNSVPAIEIVPGIETR